MAERGTPLTVGDAPAAEWASRAEVGRESVLNRHLMHSYHLPFTATGSSAWPASRRERLVGEWNFWWQAHLIDCVTDSVERFDTRQRRRLVRRMVWTHYRVNGMGWRFNPYYDDLAWAALAVQRAATLGFVPPQVARGPLRLARRRFVEAFDPRYALPWRVGDEFWNTPANGPAAIFLARLGDGESVALAERMADWMYRELRLTEGPYRGLYVDGLRIVEGKEKRVDQVFTYCQGVAMGAELELALLRTGRKRLEHVRRVCELVEACERSLLSPEGVVLFGGGGDGGLFNGIFLRYLADVALRLPNLEDFPPGEVWSGRAFHVREAASHMVFRNAQAVWETSVECTGGRLFSARWRNTAMLPLPVEELRSGRKPSGKTSDSRSLHATTPSLSLPAPGAEGDGRSTKIDGAVRSSVIAERDMSTQLSGWMTLEAAARLVRAGRCDC